MEVKTFLSPVKKLVRFFERSRNGWKRKCQEAKRRIKRLSNDKLKLRPSATSGLRIGVGLKW